jgi:hypothetical protein
MGRCRSCVSLLLLLAVLSGCQSSPPPLGGTRESAIGLARDVLQALAAGDTAALESLALSEQEFRDHVWPDLPAARPERNLPFSYVWGDLKQKSDTSLRGSLRRMRERSLTLIDVRFGGESVYGRSRVHRDSVFVVRSPDGATEDLEVCGSLIERDGRWKVFSYVVD